MTTKTGFPVGRPRKGELRPITESMKRKREYYAKRAKDPLFLAALAAKQAKWRAAHPLRNAEIAENGRRRQKIWNTIHEVSGKI